MRPARDLSAENVPEGTGAGNARLRCGRLGLLLRGAAARRIASAGGAVVRRRTLSCGPWAPEARRRCEPSSDRCCLAIGFGGGCMPALARLYRHSTCTRLLVLDFARPFGRRVSRRRSDLRSGGILLLLLPLLLLLGDIFLVEVLRHALLAGRARLRGTPACGRRAASSWCPGSRADRTDPSRSCCRSPSALPDSAIRTTAENEALRSGA